jgi:predicted choloylglycine hydrolase
MIFFVKYTALLFALIMVIFSGGCATVKRGSNTELVIKTTPPGARLSTTMPERGIVFLHPHNIAKIKVGRKALPSHTYRSCDATPCTMTMPRGEGVFVLVEKEGYLPQILQIEALPYKEVKKRTAKNTAIAGGAAGAVGAAVGITLVSTPAALTASPAVVVAGSAAILAAPFVAVGIMSGSIDAVTRANYDLWPNPVEIILSKAEDIFEAQRQREVMREQLRQFRKQRLLTPFHKKDEALIAKEVEEMTRYRAGRVARKKKRLATSKDKNQTR